MKIEEQKSKVCPKCKVEKLFNQYYRDITTKLGISVYCMPCQRKQASDYEKTEKGKATVRRKNANMVAKYPIKSQARRILHSKVKSGVIIKPTQCSLCNNYFQKRWIQAHHEDYNRPLDVLWLCDICHKKKHNKIIDKQLILRAEAEQSIKQ